MFKYFYGFSAVLVAGFVVAQFVRPQANDYEFMNRGTTSISAGATSDQFVPPQIAGSFPPPASRPETAGQPPIDVSQPPSQSLWSPDVAPRTDVGGNVVSQYGITETSQRAPVPLTTVTPLASTQPFVGAEPNAVQSADGTWRDDGRYVIININGKEMKLLKASSVPPQSGQGSLASFDNQLQPVAEPLQSAAPTDSGIFSLPPTGPETIGSGSVLPETLVAPVQPTEGTVHGRLLQKGYPLVNCYVVIAPWPKGDASDSSVDTRTPLSTMTNDEGFYCFEHVPAGEYKLTWLPEGTKQWIRRIAMRPDVIVHEGQDVTLKDIRMAMQTIN